MYRWPLLLRVEGRTDAGEEHLELQVPARGAAFTLTTLMHLGHPIHLALIDAYLRGEVPYGRGRSVGSDSHFVVANLLDPLVCLYRQGIDRARLQDVILLPPSIGDAGSSRFVITAESALTWVRRDLIATKRRPSDDEMYPWAAAWWASATGLPRPELVRARLGGGLLPVPLEVQIREAEDTTWESRRPDSRLLQALRGLALGLFSAAPTSIRQAVQLIDRLVADKAGSAGADERGFLLDLLLDVASAAADHGLEPSPEVRQHALDLGGHQLRVPMRLAAWQARARGQDYSATSLPPLDLVELGQLARDASVQPRLIDTAITAEGVPVAVTLKPGPGLASTLALVPRVGESQGAVDESMRDTTWAVLEALLQVPLGERRTEAIDLRLVGAERTAELSIGWSLVLPRNQHVFAAWLGSDGRALIRLQPRG